MSWYSKKQKCISLSIAETKYIATDSCCTQLLVMRQMFSDYGITQKQLLMFYNNTRAINITKFFMKHSKKKHIVMRHHSIRELVEQGLIDLEYISTQKQLIDILTKSLDA